MEKRLVLAIALSLLILLSWSAWIQKTQPIVNKEVKSQPYTPVVASKQISAPKPEQKISPSSLLNFKQDKFEITFIESSAAIKEVVFNDYQNYKFSLQRGFASQEEALSFKRDSSSENSITFVHVDDNKKITKTFVFDNSYYTIELDVGMQNLSASVQKMDLPLILGVLDFDPKNIQARYQDVTVVGKDKISHLSARQDVNLTAVNFLGLRDRYFCAVIEPELNSCTAFVRKINRQESEVGLTPSEITLLPQESTVQKFRIYLGPQELKLINRINPAWLAVIHYGTFDFISRLLLQLLNFLHGLVRNWGLAIVILSLVIYMILYPLSVKQMRSMKEMQALQPHIEELRKAHKDNPQKMNKEIMVLYRKHKVNPFSGCLPLILQIPIFFALYQALMRAVALKGANFLWIKDLSEPDRLFVFAKSLPVIGNEFNILPIVMAIGMFFQQKISMTATGSSAEQQKMMLIIMPVMFGAIFYHMPSGLVLYWFINSALMLVNQLRISGKK